MTVYLNTLRAEKYSKAMCYNNNASDKSEGTEITVVSYPVLCK